MSTLTNENWIDFLFDKLPEGATPWVCGFPADPKDKPNGKWTGRAYRPALPGDAFGGFSPTWNNYLSVASIKEGGRRHGSDFAAMHAVMIDDLCTKVHPKAIKLEPSLWLETSPGNYQAWYKLDPPVADPTIASSFVASLIRKLVGKDGKDPGMAGIVRYGRLPVGANTKEGGCFAHRPLDFKPLSYSLEQFVEAFGLSLRPVDAPKVSTPRPGADLIAKWLIVHGYVVAQLDDKLQLNCPFNDHGVHPHRTFYWPPSDKFPNGGFKCHHGKCEHMNVHDLIRLCHEQARKEAAA